MRADFYLKTIIELMLIFSLLAGIGILIGSVRESFLATHNTENQVLMHDAMMLLMHRHENNFGTSYGVVDNADFLQGRISSMNASAIGIKIDLVSAADENLTPSIYVNREYYLDHAPMTFADQWGSLTLRQPVTIRDPETSVFGAIMLHGVHRK
jgi:hypothetical protein